MQIIARKVETKCELKFIFAEKVCWNDVYARTLENSGSRRDRIHSRANSYEFDFVPRSTMRNIRRSETYNSPAGLRVRALLPAQVLAVPAVPLPWERSQRAKPPMAPPLHIAVLPVNELPADVDSTTMPPKSLSMTRFAEIVLPVEKSRRIPS